MSARCFIPDEGKMKLNAIQFAVAFCWKYVWRFVAHFSWCSQISGEKKVSFHLFVSLPFLLPLSFYLFWISSWLSWRFFSPFSSVSVLRFNLYLWHLHFGTQHISHKRQRMNTFRLESNGTESVCSTFEICTFIWLMIHSKWKSPKMSRPFELNLKDLS